MEKFDFVFKSPRLLNFTANYPHSNRCITSTLDIDNFIKRIGSAYMFAVICPKVGDCPHAVQAPGHNGTNPQRFLPAIRNNPD